MQYNVIICDDEEYIANSTAMFLSMCTKWELNVRVFDTSANAAKCLQEAKVDLLIADIQMPGISGLELMKNALSVWPMCQVILLTAHSVFEYVYDAIQHENVSYILKADGHEALLSAVEKALERLENTAKREMVYDKAMDLVKSAMPYLQRELILDLVHGVHYKMEKLKEIQKQLNFLLDLTQPMSIWVMLMQVYSRDENYLDRAKRMNMVLALGRRYMPEQMLLLPVQLDNQKILCLVQDNDGRKISPVQLEGILENLQEAAGEQLNIKFSAIYTADVLNYTYLQERYEQIKFRQSAMAIGGQEMWLLSLESLAIEKEQSVLMDGQYQTKARLWRNAFENGDPQSDEALEELLLPLNSAASLQDPIPREMYMHLSIQIASILRNGKQYDLSQAGISPNQLFQIECHATPEAAAAYIRHAVSVIRTQRKDTASNSMKQIVDRVILYVKDHLGEDVSLTRLAEHVGINATYLSRVYHRATGETLISYISSEKMKQAYKLLEDPTVKMQQISQSLGFLNPAYFSFFFKKNTGITPSEYRERMMH